MDTIHYIKKHDNSIIELYFQSIPNNHTRTKLKTNNWKWSSNKKCWYKKFSFENESFVVSLGATELKSYKASFNNGTTPQKNVSTLYSLLESYGINIADPALIQNSISKISKPSPKALNVSITDYQQNNAIGVILLDEDGKYAKIGISNISEIQNSSENIYWINRTISKKIISGIINNRPWIYHNEKLYLICSYTNTALLRTIKKHTSYFSNSSKYGDIWIYSLKMPCSTHPKAVESVTAYVPVSGDALLKEINIYHCPECKKYYINAEQYIGFAKKYGLPNVRLRLKATEHISDFSNLREESILHFIGYNVSENDNLSEDERRKKLLHALNTHAMTKAEIISFLEYLIHRSEGNIRFYNACAKWKRDAEFIRNYALDKQKKIITSFKI